MSAHLTDDAGHIRIFEPGQGYGDPFSGVVAYSRIGSYIVHLHAAVVEHGDKHLTEIVDECRRIGALRVRLIRKGAHKMPRPWRRVETIRDETTWELKTGE